VHSDFVKGFEIRKPLCPTRFCCERLYEEKPVQVTS